METEASSLRAELTLTRQRLAELTQKYERQKLRCRMLEGLFQTAPPCAVINVDEPASEDENDMTSPSYDPVVVMANDAFSRMVFPLKDGAPAEISGMRFSELYSTKDEAARWTRRHELVSKSNTARLFRLEDSKTEQKGISDVQTDEGSYLCISPNNGNKRMSTYVYERYLHKSENPWRDAVKATGIWTWNALPQDEPGNTAKEATLDELSLPDNMSCTRLIQILHPPIIPYALAWLRTIHPDDIQKAAHCLLKCVEDDRDTFRFVGRLAPDIVKRTPQELGQSEVHEEEQPPGSYINRIVQDDLWILCHGFVVKRKFSSDTKANMDKHDRNGNCPISFAGISVDISRIKHAELKAISEMKLFEKILGGLPAVVYHSDARTLSVRYTNRHWEKLMCTEQECAYDQRWRDAIHPADAERLYEESMKGVKTGKPYTNHYRVIKPNGEIAWQNCVTVPFDAPESPQGVLGIAWDVTEQKLLQFELEEKRKALNEAVRAKNLFLANFSHELRTPLNGLLGFMALLRETLLSQEQIELLDTMEHCGGRLNNMLSDLLDFSKLEAKKLVLHDTPFGIRKVIRETIEQTKTQNPNEKVSVFEEIDYKVPNAIIADPLRFSQILGQLVSNAIKFTAEGSVIINVAYEPLEEVIQSATSTPDCSEFENSNPFDATFSTSDMYFPKTHSLTVSVKDTGCGLNNEAMARLFLSFSQTDHFSKLGGLGLGLAICKALVQKMGGQIWAESAGTGMGSTFFFTIPVAISTDELHASITETDGTLTSESSGTSNATSTSESVSEASNTTPAPVSKASNATSGLVSEASNTTSTPSNGDPPPSIYKCASAVGSALQEPLKRRTENLTTKSQVVRPQPDILQGVAWPLKILVAEDHPTNQKLMMRLLSKAGYAPGLAADGVEAVEAYRKSAREEQWFDLILMDMQMPNMSGAEATKLLREEFGPSPTCFRQKSPQPGCEVSRSAASKIFFKKEESSKDISCREDSTDALPSTPTQRPGPIVIALTANSSASDLTLYKESGMDGFLSKPLQLPSLNETLERCSIEWAMYKKTHEDRTHLLPEEGVEEPSRTKR